MGTGAALAGGLVAGLGVAMPLGAVGVLLVQEGALRGARRGLPGAAGVASVDALYCALAVLIGGAVAPRIASWRAWPASVGGLALLVVAGVGLRRGLAALPDPVPAATAPDEASARRGLRTPLAATAPDEASARRGLRTPLAATASDEASARRGLRTPLAATASDEASARRGLRTPLASAGTGWRRYALFVGLTAVNPATLVYFVALLSGLAALTDRAATAVAFVVGVGAASFGWQALLVVGGGVLGGRAGPGARRTTVVVGNAVVAVLGALTLARAG